VIKIKYSFITLLLAIAITQATGQEKPTWRFTILAGISDTTANYYGGFSNASNLILEQIDIVNARFNNPGVFDGIFQFEVDSIYEFSGNPYNQVFKPHPNHSFRVIYDGFPTQGGGWFGDYNAIYGAWPVDYFGGTFGDYATDGSVHEFGHARGAIDLYALSVDAENNPINNSAYQPETSIMTYPYDIRVWDRHTISIVNYVTDDPSPPISYITESFPDTIGVKVNFSNRNPVPNAKIRMFPVYWYSDSVNSTSLPSKFTDSTGHYFFTINPFVPNNCNFPWCIKYCNFLVSVEHDETVLFQWMPLTKVQNFYFEYPESTFCLTFTIELPRITVTSPNGGEEWQVGSNHNITWSSHGTSGNVRIDYSTNNGSSWTEEVANTTDDGSYSWTIPGTPSDNCRVRVRDTDGSLSDISNSSFTISPIPSITIITPNGDEDWKIDSTYDITWISNSTSGDVRIEYSTDNGSSWSEVIASMPNTGVYSWTIPDSHSDSCLVLICDTAGVAADTSDALFTISPSSAVPFSKSPKIYSMRVKAVTAVKKFEIEYDLPERTDLIFGIYDIKGTKIKEISEERNAGAYSIEVDMSNNPAGVYFIRMEVNDGKFTQTRKFLLM